MEGKRHLPTKLRKIAHVDGLDRCATSLSATMSFEDVEERDGKHHLHLALVRMSI
jgi:hypothetical protein